VTAGLFRFLRPDIGIRVIHVKGILFGELSPILQARNPLKTHGITLVPEVTSRCGRMPSNMVNFELKMSVAAIAHPIAVSERLRRREAVENAFADLRLEGLAPTPEARLIMERFVQGELTEEQVVRAILAR